MSKLVKIEGLSRRYLDGLKQPDKEASFLQVLENVNFELALGEMHAIIGSSGSGKSTLLHCIAGLEPIDSGRVEIDGQQIHARNNAKMAQWRNQNLGFVYQFHHLLAEFDALENVAMPLLIAGVSLRQAKLQAEALLEEVGLSNRLKHFPSQLSGGERQRVAIARALVNKPKLILADEPTGNLDEVTALQIYDLMIRLNQSMNTAFILVTHDLSLAKKLPKQSVLQQGTLQALASQKIGQAD